MKKIITLICCLLYSYGASIFASTFTIQVPQALLGQNSSLMVYMVDDLGQQHIGKCFVDNQLKYRTIVQQELEMTTIQEAESFVHVVDLTNSEQILQQDVVILHFELNTSVRILRILIVKDSFLEENPFDVLTLSVAQNDQFEQNHHSFYEFDTTSDDLSLLVDNVDTESLEKSLSDQHDSISFLDKCKLYAEIYMLLQYGKVKRAVNNISSWFAH